jgi:hypothetical protein
MRSLGVEQAEIRRHRAIKVMRVIFYLGPMQIISTIPSCGFPGSSCRIIGIVEGVT